MKNPYEKQKQFNFWNTAVSDRHIGDLEDICSNLLLKKDDKIATAGSCFAQHIHRNLKIRKATVLELEPAPITFPNNDEEKRFGYGVYSCRYGNIYTSRQMLQLFLEAYGERKPSEIIWEKNNRYFDALRPNVDPVGYSSKENLLKSRSEHLSKVKLMFESLDLFIFTMGLTECWMSKHDGTIYPSAPGVIAGSYDENKYSFCNLNYNEVMNDIDIFWHRLKKINPTSRMLLTISPVPLKATATDNHILSATTYSKSVLRAVAGDLIKSNSDIFYFPSYEIIASHPSRGIFFDPDLRTVNKIGVDLVMKYFFNAISSNLSKNKILVPEDKFDPICDEDEIT